MDGLIIGAASPDMTIEIAAIERLSFSDPWSDADFAALCGNPCALFLAASDASSGRVAGYAVLLHAADIAELANLAVAPDRRREGIGAALLDATLDFCRGNGVADVTLEVRESNVAARALYTSRGFADVGRRRAYYRLPREDALVMLLRM